VAKAIRAVGHASVTTTVAHAAGCKCFMCRGAA
jgi:hypothetical protein